MKGLIFEPETNNILLGSRKINFWNFKTQEESKTSHDAPVAYALYNTQFESVVSGSDDGWIAVWDMENGRQLTKFQNGKGEKLTAGCFDRTQRRMVTAGTNGQVKIWNFSNGSVLKNLLGPQKPGTQVDPKADPLTLAASRPVDKEVTSLVCIYDPNDNGDQPTKQSHFVAAGWDRRLRIWQDDTGKEENLSLERDLPIRYSTTQQTHGDDIMCAIYDHMNNLIFTGAHDGTLQAWHFETGFIKFYLH